MKESRIKNQESGFTLFVAMVLTATLLLIATGVIGLVVRQSHISASSRESQMAFYAADTGVECALYWDVQNPSGVSAFATTSSSTIFCNQDPVNNPSNPVPAVVGGSGASTFRIDFLPDPSCTVVTVTKNYVSSVLVTKVESKGYNTCDSANPRRVERAVRAIY